MKHGTIKVSLTIILACSVLVSLYACTTKVSEWTLLNFEPEPYMLVYFTDGGIPAPVQREQEEMVHTIGNANVVLYTVDISDFHYEAERELYAQVGDRPLPCYALYYRHRLFEIYSSLKELASLTGSPMRRTIADSLKNGDLCVLVYLESGKARQDVQGARTIQRYLASSELKDIITVMHLSRTDVKERMFVRLLTNVESDLKTIEEPMVFGIFGRLRALEPLVGQGITDENLEYMMQFFTMDCSCFIKYQMPGTDIPCPSEWQEVKPAKLHQIWPDEDDGAGGR